MYNSWLTVDPSTRNNQIWVFNAGDAFSGNPKWLFLYVVNHRPDIKPYWLCYKKELLEYMRRLGYKAYLYRSAQGKKIMAKAGVYVVDQVKEAIQPELQGIKILNLWHGVGCKSIERKVNFGFLNERITKKYIENNYYYKNFQLFLVTSPLMEKHFKAQCGIDDDKVVRAGYPCCIANEFANSYDHDILKRQGLPADTKIVIYSPTYRDASSTEFFGKAMPDLDALSKVLEEKNMLLIFKMHPKMMNDVVYLDAMKQYSANKRFLFWDNKDDIYEIFNTIDIAIIDYSSIFYDMLAAGIKHFIRYMFDIDDKNNLRDFVFDVKEMTCGTDCSNYQELLYALQSYQEDEKVSDEKQQQIYDLFWEYAKGSGNDDIVNAALSFKPEPRELPVLYSFDIFDTLISRKGLKPISIFYKVQDELLHEEQNYSSIILRDFPKVRMQCEENVREWYRKTQYRRTEDRLEITLDEIYERMQEMYGLTDMQKSHLEELEVQAEIEDTIPCTDKIAHLKKLVDNGEKVILISDMYLPESVIHQMLVKADPVLGEIPLYLSNVSGAQKTTKKLYLEVFQSMEYNFSKWIHYGDNQNADYNKPLQLGIQPEIHDVPDFNEYEMELVDALRSYDGYLAAASMARFRAAHPDCTESELFTYCYASLYFVPYVNWCLKHALQKGIKTVYFISRDGYHLKRIADCLIEIKQYPLKTKYIYGSRQAWRIPSFIDHVDDEFFTEFGNFNNIRSYSKLLKAMDVTSEQFKHFLPEYAYLEKVGKITRPELARIRIALKTSAEYSDYILQKAKEERPIILKYMQQEIDFSESFAFIEYWGRGYTQECMTRLLAEAAGRQVQNIYYYARSIYGTEGDSIRYNYTSNSESLIVIEALFANLHYKSIAKYKDNNGHIEPVIIPADNDKVLQKAFEEYLPQFAKDLYSSVLQDENRFEYEIFNFAFEYYKNNITSPIYVNQIAHLKDSVDQYGKIQEFAPKLTTRSVFARLIKQDYFYTKSKEMSMARSNIIYQKGYDWFKNNFKSSPAYTKIRRFRVRVKKRFHK